MTRRPRGHAGRFVHRFLIASLAAFASAVATPASADTLRGRVVDPQARAVAGAEVLVLRGAEVVAAVRTGPDGSFGPVALPPGRYDVVASATGLRADASPVTLDARTPAADLTVRLSLSAVRESVVVSAAQVDVARSRATDATAVIDRDELQAQQAATVADAVRLVPGFGVVASGGPGAIVSFFPRGGESDYTLVLVNGVPQNAFGGGFDAAHLGAAAVDRVEVVRGPQSALYGGGAIGGVVHILTDPAPGPAEARAAFEWGGYGTRSATAAAAGSARRWHWSGTFEYAASDGDTREWPSLGRRVANDDYARVTGGGGVTWAGDYGRRVRATLRVDRSDRGNPGPYGSNPIGAYTGLDTISRTRNLTRDAGVWAAFGAGSTAHRVQFTSRDGTHDFASPFGDSFDDVRRLSGRYQTDVAAGAAALSIGAELLHERADNTFVTGDAARLVPIERFIAGWFAEARQPLGNRASATVGVRVERIRRTALEADGSVFGFRPAFGDDVVWSVNPRASAAWFVRGPDGRGWTKLRAAAGTGIKPPTVFEIAFTDNPGLRPERSRSVDAGVEQAFAGSALVADLGVFYNRYDDLIVNVGATLEDASSFSSDNVANARSRGLEAGLAWRAPAGLFARAAWTRLDTAILAVDNVPRVAPSPFVVGDPLIRRPRHQGALLVTWTGARADAFVRVAGRGRMLDVEPTFGAVFGGLYDTPGFTTVAAGGAVRMHRRIQVYGRVTNLFDRAHEEAFGFPALGRTGFVGVRVTAGR